MTTKPSKLVKEVSEQYHLHEMMIDIMMELEKRAKEEGRHEAIKEIYKDLLTRDEHIRRVKQQARKEERKKIIKWFNDCFVNDNKFNWWKFEKILKKPIKEKP